MIRQLAVLAIAAICLSGSTTARSVEAAMSTEDMQKAQEYSDLLLLTYDSDYEIKPEIKENSKKFNYEELLKLDTDSEFISALKHFWHMYQNRLYLPRGHIFSLFEDDHLKQAVAIFDVFYYAPNFSVLKTIASWARAHINQEIFIYTYSAAIIHRNDTRFIVLPLPHKMFPNLFFNTDFLAPYYERQMIIHKGDMNDQELVEYLHEPIWANYTHTWVETTRDPETSLTYFFEDIGVNICYYYMQLLTPFWMSSSKYPVSKLRGALYFFSNKWILNRIEMERLSHNLKPIEYINWNKQIATGYTPMMIHSNGIMFPQRKEWSFVPGELHPYVDEMLNYEKRLAEAIDFGRIMGKDGKFIPIAEGYEGIGQLANLIEGNADSLHYDYYGSIDKLGRKILGFSPKRKNAYHLMPSALEKFATTMRDPAFYRNIHKMLHNFEKMEKHVKPRKSSEITSGHFSIKSFKVDTIITYFETYDTLVSNISKPDGLSFGVEARQTRLNCKNVKFYYNIKSDAIIKASVRVFIGPELKIHEKPSFEDYKKYYLIDYFVHDMVVGENEFTRELMDSPIGIPDFHDYPWTENEEARFKLGFGWPSRLLFPKGTCEGMPARLYVHISEFVPLEENEDPSVPFPWPALQLDNKPWEFPIDKPMEDYNFAYPNSRSFPIHIYHKDKSHIKNLTS